MKAGIILIILEIISLIPSFVTGENVFDNNFAYILGRFSFGIVGVILIIKAYKKKNREQQNESKEREMGETNGKNRD